MTNFFLIDNTFATFLALIHISLSNILEIIHIRRSLGHKVSLWIKRLQIWCLDTRNIILNLFDGIFLNSTRFICRPINFKELMAYDVFYLASRVATEFEKICDCKMNHNCDYVYRMNRLLDPKSFNMYIRLAVSFLGTKFYYEILLFCSSFLLSLYSRLNANQKIYKSKRNS